MNRAKAIKAATHRPQFRRRRSGRTDYRARKKLLLSELPRAVVRKTNRSILVQVVEFELPGDRIIASAISKELKKFGWVGSTASTPAAYLTGYAAGKRALRHKVERAVLDIGLHAPSKGARVFGALKGLLDAGLEIPHSDSVLPSKERIEGKHLKQEVPENFKSVKSKLEEALK